MDEGLFPLQVVQPCLEVETDLADSVFHLIQVVQETPKEKTFDC